jgi:hypothetical protein
LIFFITKPFVFFHRRNEARECFDKSFRWQSADFSPIDGVVCSIQLPRVPRALARGQRLSKNGL